MVGQSVHHLVGRIYAAARQGNHDDRDTEQPDERGDFHRHVDDDRIRFGLAHPLGQFMHSSAVPRVVLRGPVQSAVGGRFACLGLLIVTR